jgi:hypothetical protein
MRTNEFQAELVADMASFTNNPTGYVLYSYDWGNGELTGAGCTGPRKWQRKILNDIGERLADKKSRFQPIQIAVASGHGIGKSALISMITMWGLSTHEDCKVLVTANTESQLRTKTWPEVTKWCNLAINTEWFTATANAVISTQKKHEKAWRADAVPWSSNNTEAFAGLHNKGKRIIIIFDEASAIDDTIWEVTEGALTDENTEIIWLAFGNPTRCDGRFHECFYRFKHRWITYQIDSREVEGTNKEQIQKVIDDYGEDSDYAKVRVRGIFPSASPNQLIPRESIDECFKYTAIEYEWHAKVLGVDVARFGSNQTVARMRQGRKVYPAKKWRGLDGMQTASNIVEIYENELPDAVFIDEGGMGGPIIDRVRQLIPREKVFPVNFGWKANDPTRYHNKRAEMWSKMADAIKEGLDIERDEELANDLTMLTYMFDKDQRIQLPRKEDMDYSPDDGDALALTFAEDVIRDKPKKKKKQFSGGWMG